mgnify:CR=1 FL=1
MTKQNQTITVNRLPAKTWNWLKMNETVIGMPRIDGSIAIKQSVAEAGRAEDEQLRMAQQTDWDKSQPGWARRWISRRRQMWHGIPSF